MGSFSLMHWMIVLLIVLLLFGAGKLPRVMGDFAKGIKAFKSGMKEEDDEAAVTPPKQQVPPPSSTASAEQRRARPAAEPRRGSRIRDHDPLFAARRRAAGGRAVRSAGSLRAPSRRADQDSHRRQ